MRSVGTSPDRGVKDNIAPGKEIIEKIINMKNRLCALESNIYKCLCLLTMPGDPPPLGTVPLPQRPPRIIGKPAIKSIVEINPSKKVVVKKLTYADSLGEGTPLILLLKEMVLVLALEVLVVLVVLLVILLKQKIE